MDKFIGFYWTLPVPWAGFADLPESVEEATAKSKTIRYQRERVRTWVRDQKGQLIEEKAFLELSPDRGTEQILPEIERLIIKGQKEGASLVLVDFSEAFGWRRHGLLYSRLGNEKFCVCLDPVPVLIDGVEFDPVSHFRAWRQVDYARISSKPEREEQIRRVIHDLKEGHSSLTEMVETLNKDGIRTPTGKLWTDDNLRKFLKAK